MTSRQLDHQLLALSFRQSGAFAARQATAIGLSYAQLQRRERRGDVKRIRQRLYVHAGFPPSWRQDLWLELLAAGPESAVSAEAAAQLHGFRTYNRNRVEVERRQGGNHEAVRGVLHETFWLPRSHIVEIDGLPVTSVARTVFDLAGLPRHPRAFQNDALRETHIKRITWLVNAAMRDHGMTMLDLNRVLVAVGRRGKPGTSIIRAVVGDLGLDYVPTDSELEDLFLELCDSARIRRPDRQVNVGTNERWIGRVDFVWRPERFIAEVDGSQHRAPLDRRADRSRDEATASVGMTTERFTYWDLVHRPEHVIASVRGHLRAAAA